MRPQVEGLDHCPVSQFPRFLIGLPSYCSGQVSVLYHPARSRGWQNKKAPWPESASEVYRPSDLRLLAKLVPTFADTGFHVVSVTDPYGRILRFLDRTCYFFFQVAPQL
jgi:hypothetical protein